MTIELAPKAVDLRVFAPSRAKVFPFLTRSREGAKQGKGNWIPAFAGMTEGSP
jgi:hypothetical protein